MSMLIEHHFLCIFLMNLFTKLKFSLYQDVCQQIYQVYAMYVLQFSHMESRKLIPTNIIEPPLLCLIKYLIHFVVDQ